MPNDRFYSDSSFVSGSEVILEEEEFHHLFRVTRTKEGDSVELVNGRGQLAHARVEKMDKRSARLSVLDVSDALPPRIRIVLAQAIPRINRLDLIVEKGTELGMAEIWLFPGEKSEKKELSENQINRLVSISVAAMKQCGRLFLPPIRIFPPLQKWKPLPYPGFFGDISKNAPILMDEWNKDPPSKELYFFIGPESGFTPSETALLASNNLKGVSMHENILRTDTAAIASLAILGHLTLKLESR